LSLEISKEWGKVLQKDKSGDKNKNNKCEKEREIHISAREGECFAALQTQV
jgi:hypothetical protein